MALAYVFPGQGSQFVGMGQALAEAFPAAREVFEEVDDALERRLSATMWTGEKSELDLTVNTQPALMAHSIAVVRVLEKELSVDFNDCMFMAGHSLGEYSALCAAGAIPLADTARLLQFRGEAMQAAVPAGEGAMAALLGADEEKAQAAIDATPGDGVLEIANDNAPGQIVVSGDKARVEAMAADVKAHGIKLAKLLPVSGPFHSSLMAPAAEKMEEKLAGVDIVGPGAPIVANVTASAVVSPDDIRRLLVEQVTGRVRWRESGQYMRNQGVERFVELGAGKTLIGLLKRITPDATLSAIGEPGEIDAFAETR